MQNAANPDEFAHEPSIDLTGWRGEDEFGPWRELARVVTGKAGVAPPPPPAPRAASGFFQPGALSPQTARPPGPPATAPRLATVRGPTPAAAPRAMAHELDRPPLREVPPPPPPRAFDEPPRQRGGSPIAIILIVVLVLAAAGAGGFFVLNNMRS